MKVMKYVLVGIMSIGFVSTISACGKTEKQKAEEIHKDAETHVSRANTNMKALDDQYDINLMQRSYFGGNASNKDWSNYTPAQRTDIRNKLLAVAESCGRLREIKQNRDSKTAIYGDVDGVIQNAHEYIDSLNKYEAANP